MLYLQRILFCEFQYKCFIYFINNYMQYVYSNVYIQKFCGTQRQGATWHIIIGVTQVGVKVGCHVTKQHQFFFSCLFVLWVTFMLKVNCGDGLKGWTDPKIIKETGCTVYYVNWGKVSNNSIIHLNDLLIQSFQDKKKHQSVEHCFIR